MEKRGGPQGQTPARGGCGEWHWQPAMSGVKKGPGPPPSDKGVKMFEMGQFNVFTPDVKKGGGHKISGFFAVVGTPWG